MGWLGLIISHHRIIILITSNYSDSFSLKSIKNIELIICHFHLSIINQCIINCFNFCMIFGFLLTSDFQAQLMFDYNNTQLNAFMIKLILPFSIDFELFQRLLLAQKHSKVLKTICFCLMFNFYVRYKRNFYLLHCTFVPIH